MKLDLPLLIVAALGFGMLGFGLHGAFAPEQKVEAQATDREKVSEGTTVLNVMPGARILVYPTGAFILQAPEGGVTIVQMPAQGRKK